MFQIGLLLVSETTCGSNGVLRIILVFSRYLNLDCYLNLKLDLRLERQKAIFYYFILKNMQMSVAHKKRKNESSASS